MSGRKSSKPSRTCKKKCQVTTNDQTITCFQCCDSYHIHCANISVELFDLLGETKPPNLVWFCDPCFNKSQNINTLAKDFSEKSFIIMDEHEKQIQKIQENIEKMQSTMKQSFIDLENKVMNKVDNQKKVLNDVINSYTEVVSDNMSKNKATYAEIACINKDLKIVKNNIESQLGNEEEAKIHEHKAKNVIVFNVPESL